MVAQALNKKALYVRPRRTLNRAELEYAGILESTVAVLMRVMKPTSRLANRALYKSRALKKERAAWFTYNDGEGLG